MKSLKYFEKDLNTCSKCGLCQSVCPLFKLDPNECVVSKGKFIMLHGVTKGDLKLSKNINKYLDMCLKCGKCNAFCPSGIDVCQILNTAKYEYMKKTFCGKFINFLQNRVIFSNLLNFLYFLSKPFRKKFNRPKNPSMRVVYFKGCVNKILPLTDNYISKIFQNSDIEIITPDFDCCGLPFLSEGNLERFIEAAKYNLSRLDVDFDYMVTDCASCESTVLDYKNYVEHKNLLPAEKSVNWGDLIALNGFKFKFKKSVKVTFHKPCHLKNDAFLMRIIKNCENVEYIKMPDYDACCGLSGSFTLKNRSMSVELAKQKARNIIKTGADIVITTCPACIMGLKQGLVLSGSKIKVKSLLEFLSEGNIIK